MLLTLAALTAVGLQSPARFTAEAARLTRETIATFYDAKVGIWRPPVASAEAVGRQGYTFWPSMLAWQAVIEAAKVDPATWKPQIATYYAVLEKYFDRAGHAYCAWTYFPGNDDKFYDDNGWAAVACMEAYEVTHEVRYRLRAIDVFENYVKGGWDTGPLGGVRWGTKAGIEDRKDRTVSATAASALAALLIAKSQDKAVDQAWAKRALDWIRTKLSAPSGLIYDGFHELNSERMNTIWTYNTGVPIRAAVEYARQTGDKSYLAWAKAMGDASLDRSQSPLFDGAVTDLGNRHWFDGTYFVHYLVDGLAVLGKATGDPRYVAEARREADYCIDYLRDRDGLYWRNMRLWTINTDRQQAFLKVTHQTGPALSADGSERSGEAAALALPVEKRPMAKTLLGNAGAARMFWLLARA